MSKKEIYGEVPELKGDCKTALSDALKDLGESFSNEINGKVNDKRDVEYNPEDGK